MFQFLIKYACSFLCDAGTVFKACETANFFSASTLRCVARVLSSFEGFSIAPLTNALGLILWVKLRDFEFQTKFYLDFVPASAL